MYYLIYQTTNKINGKIYVGKHITKDLNDGYLGSGKYLHNAIEKYGIENFERTILFFCETEDEMNAKEKEIVNEDFVARKDTYNLKIGGDGGWDYINNELHFNGIKSYHKNKSEQEIKEIYKKAGEGSQKYFANLTKEEHKKLSEKWLKYYETHPGMYTGKRHSEETKRKFSLRRKGKHTGKDNHRFGCHWWKDPNNKTKSLSIKEGDPVPEGWIRGRWQQKKK